MGSSISTFRGEEFWLSIIKETPSRKVPDVLGYAPEHIRNNKKFIMAAILQSGGGLKYASSSLQNDKQFVLDVVKAFGKELEYASSSVKNDKDVVMAAVRIYGHVLKYASPSLQNDKDVVMAAVQIDPLALQYASPSLQNDKDVVMAAVQIDPLALQYVPSSLIKNDKDVVMAAVQENGRALQYASPSLQNDKQAVMEAVKKYGMAWQFASPSLQHDKDVALVAVKQYPNIIKQLCNDLKRDRDILIAAGMFDSDHIDADARKQQRRTMNNNNDDIISRKITLSTRFDLDSDKGDTSQALNFTRLLKKSKYIQAGNFTVYAPNSFDKKTCDPEWTDFKHPCRGTEETCKGFIDEEGPYKPNTITKGYKSNILTKDGYPTDDCCWRYSFRSQLQEAKDTGGFMLQLIESARYGGKPELGNGQRIELDMANSIGTKVFQVYGPEYELFCWDSKILRDHHIDDVTKEISQWYENRCQDMSVNVIRPRY